ncbi:hypothetical protein ACIQC5_13030 [Paenarthrobacter sp. NPDC092416]|uniref:hypothetical protein n=1 Tax=Paenarthrobacter sp. NPDC092416 TaxID=3364386 RepID=UPI003827015B
MGKISHRSFVLLSLSIAVAMGVASCAIPGTVAATPSVSPGSSSPTPTQVCRLVEGMPQVTEDCVVVDPEAAMAANELYRQRRVVTPGIQEHLESYVAPAREALESLNGAATAESVVQAFGSVGLLDDAVQTDDNGNGVRFGAASPQGGCLFGYVALDGTVEISTGGSIMDGGCLEMIGH